MSDEQTAEGVVHALAGAFNAKDPSAYAALFTDDAEFVTIFGGRMRGREAIEAGHSAVFATGLAGTRLELGEIDSKPLAADVILCHATWTRERLPDAPDGTIPRGTGVFTMVLHYDGSRWALAAVTNVQDAAPPGQS